MRKYDEWKSTSNRGVYNKLHKELHAHCSRCRWNRGCNRRRKKTDNRSWKSARKWAQWKDK